MNEPKPKEQVLASVPFVVGAAARGTNALQEQRAQRVARMKQLFGQGDKVEFLGVLGLATASAVLKGQSFVLPDGSVVSWAGRDKSLRCVCCHGIHGEKATAENKPERLALTGFYRKGKQVFALSDDCRKLYLVALGHIDRLANPDAFRQTYPKAERKPS